MRWVLPLLLLFAAAACSDPTPPPPSLDEARAALARGDGLGAEIVLRQLLETGTPREDLAAWLGEAELEQGQLVEARRWLGEGTFSPDSAGVGFHMLGRLEMREGNLPAAGQAFDRALQASPDDPELWVDIGRLRYRGGEQIQAVEASEKAVALGPENPAALQFHAQILRDSHGMEAALPWFERALDHNPDNLDLLGDYAATLGELGRAKEMLTIVRRMTALDPGNPQALWLEAVLAARAGDYDLARRLLQLTDDAHRESPAGQLLSGVIDMRSGNYASASQTFDGLLDAQPDNRRVRLLLARALALDGSHRELVFRFGDVALRPSSPPYLTLLVGQGYEALGERDKAAQYLDRAATPRGGELVAVPGTVPLAVVELRGVDRGSDALSLVRGLIVAGQPGAASAKAEAFQKKYPGSADALGLAGDALLASRQIGPAIALYQRSAGVRRPWPLARRMVAAYRAAGRGQEAAWLLSEQLAGDPANVEAAATLGRIAFEAKDMQRAELLLDHAIANGGTSDPDLLALRAQVALAQGDVDTARNFAGRAYRLQPMKLAVVESYRDALAARLDGKEEARQLAAKAKALAAR
ncbi:MAG: tetratricopeptide repeat protein [Sphingomonadales bacterium]|nr:tetratricopeptide repeat protein [Sphingomonadales bacterium]